MTTSTPLWEPSAERIEAAPLTAFAAKAEARAGRAFSSYAELHQWSVTQPEDFWDLVWDFCGVVGDKGETVLADGDKMPGAQFFPDARLNFAENLLGRPGTGDALVFRGDDGLDELTTTGHSRLWEISLGDVHEHDLDPRDLGIPLADIDDLLGGQPEENAAVAREELAASELLTVLALAETSRLRAEVCSGERVIDEPHCKRVLAVLATAGLYERTGDWLFEIGLPGKSGESGGIVTVAPGKGGLAVFALGLVVVTAVKSSKRDALPFCDIGLRA